MPQPTADIVICGAGIAGIATAYHLAVRHGVTDILLVDERAPLTLTSDKSTEAYRNWWPGPDAAMIRLMNRSIDIIEELADLTDNRFLLNRRGYVYATGDATRLAALQDAAARASQMGAGPVRTHTSSGDYTPSPAEGYADQLGGADILLGRDLIQAHFPYLTEQTIGLVHARRCGWFSGQQLGMTMLEMAQAHGIRFINARVTGVTVTSGQVASVQLLADGRPLTVATHCFVNAAGPMLKQVGDL